MSSNEINFQEIFETVKVAKEIGEMELANCLFGFTVGYLHDRLWDRKERDARLRVALLTNDDKGDTITESYYDLVEIRFRSHSMRIPAPMLDSLYLLAVVKRAIATDSVEWRLQPSDETEGEEPQATEEPASTPEELWERAAALTDGAMVEMAQLAISDQEVLSKITAKADVMLPNRRECA